MNEKKIFKSIDENGKEIEYEILSAFKMKQTNKDYIIYTDNTTDESGSINTYAAIYYPSEPTRKLEPIETESEWNEIEKIMQRLEI